MPNIGNIAPGIAGARTFLATLLEYFKRCKDDIPCLTMPRVGCHRNPRPNIDPSASKVDEEFAAEIELLSDRFLQSHPDGIFQAYRFDQPPHINESTTQRRCAHSMVSSTNLSPPEGQLFERHGTMYQMFRIYETIGEPGSNAVVCAYFDIELATADGRGFDFFAGLEKDYERSNFEELDLDYLLVSHLSDVMQWIADSDLPNLSDTHATSDLRRSTRSKDVEGPISKVGAVIHKHFPGYGTFVGTITKFDRSTGNFERFFFF